jgi:hypothetical protein
MVLGIPFLTRGRMMQVEIEYVQSARHPGLGQCWEVAKVVTDGEGIATRVLHVMPMWAVTARMAECNVDQEEAVRILLAEPHLDQPADQAPPILADPLWRRAAAEHRAAVSALHDELGFEPLGFRAGDDARHPASAMLDEPVPAGLVASIRSVIADQRQAVREQAAVPEAGLLDLIPPEPAGALVAALPPVQMPT